MDLKLKESRRDCGRDVYNGKSVMHNFSTRKWSHPDKYGNTCIEFCNPDKVSELETQLFEAKPELAKTLYTKPHNQIPLNDKLLFENVEKILEESNYKVETKYDKNTQSKDKIYYVETKGDLQDYIDRDYLKRERQANKKPNTFDFFNKRYEYHWLYRMGEAGNLTPMCPLEIPFPILLENVVQIPSKSSIKHLKGNISCDLIHESPNYKYHSHSDYIWYDKNKFKTDTEVYDFLYSTIRTNIPISLKQERGPPIIIKLETKAVSNVYVTHLGLIGSKPIGLPIKRAGTCDPMVFFDASETSPCYITKFELYYKSIKSKKWVFLKSYTLEPYYLNALFKTQIINLTEFYNGNDSGLITNEFKIIPTEYVGEPVMRVGVYGYLPKSKTNSKQSDSDNLTAYVISNVNKTNKMIKRGRYWSAYWDYCCTDKSDKEFKRNMNNINSSIKNNDWFYDRNDNDNIDEDDININD